MTFEPTARWGRAKKDPKFRDHGHGLLQHVENTTCILEPIGYGKYRSVARDEMKEDEK